MHVVPPPGSENHPAGKHVSPAPQPFTEEELRSAARLLRTLDKLQGSEGTHLSGRADFTIYNTEGEPRVITLTHDGNGSWHLMVS